MRISSYITMTIIAIAAIMPAGCARRVITVDVGGGKITTPVPYNFLALEGKSSSFRSYVQRKLLPETLLLEYFLTNRSMKDIETNNFADLRSDKKSRSLSITMPKSMYGRDFSEENFLGYASATRATHADNIAHGESLANNRKEMIAMKSGSAPSSLENTKWAGVFYDSRDAIGEVITNEIHLGQSTYKKVGVIVTMRIKDRMIFLNCNSNIEGYRDIEWAKETCSKWSRDIMKHN